MITAVITTYKEPEALDICLNSAIKGQIHENQIIVVVDGFYDLNIEVLNKYKEKIDILSMPKNEGMIRSMNLGHYNAKFDLVFHVQDDNVFPNEWDKKLLEHYKEGCVVTPNQIEPNPSMFRQFIINNLGDINNFDLDKFWDFESDISTDNFDENGSTFPFLISKNDYLKIGGFDETYPGPWVVDWEFFMKCQLNGLKMIRSYNSHFYHFVSLGTKSPEQMEEARIKEDLCHKFAYYKWGSYIKHDQLTNKKYI